MLFFWNCENQFNKSDLIDKFYIPHINMLLSGTQCKELEKMWKCIGEETRLPRWFARQFLRMGEGNIGTMCPTTRKRMMSLNPITITVQCDPVAWAKVGLHLFWMLHYDIKLECRFCPRNGMTKWNLVDKLVDHPVLHSIVCLESSCPPLKRPYIWYRSLSGASNVQENHWLKKVVRTLQY